MFKEFTIMDRMTSIHTHNPAARPAKDEFLKSEAEITADFTYHSYASYVEVGKICPESISILFSKRHVEDPVRLLMYQEATDSIEENY